MANLYDLNQNYNNLLEVLETTEDSNLTEMIKLSLEQVNEDIKQKTDNIVKFIRNLDSDILALKEEEKKLADKRKTLENSKKRLEMYLYDFTKASEGKKLKGNIFELIIKKNSPKLIVDDSSYIPKEYIAEEVVIKIDNAGLKKYLKDNVVQGCRLEQGESLKIK